MKIDMRRYAECASSADLAARLLADLKPAVDGVHLLRNRVLVASYVRPERTKGGIILADKTLDEDKWQGKVGLILKIGPDAFNFEEVKNDADVLWSKYSREDRGDAAAYSNAIEDAKTNHNIPKVGDWVFFRGSDTWDSAIQIEPGTGAHCRFIFDDAIIGRIEDPSAIW